MKKSEIPYGQVCVTRGQWSYDTVIPLEPGWSKAKYYSKNPYWKEEGGRGIACAQYRNWGGTPYWTPTVLTPQQIDCTLAEKVVRDEAKRKRQKEEQIRREVYLQQKIELREDLASKLSLVIGENRYVDLNESGSLATLQTQDLQYLLALLDNSI